jgi:hypothetical protein
MTCGPPPEHTRVADRSPSMQILLHRADRVGRMFSSLQETLLLVLGLGVIGLTGFALLDAVRQRKDAYTAANKLTKPIWCGILAVATIIAIIVVRNPLVFGIFTIISVVAAGVYLADVRPALRNITGGGGNWGPYGGR